MNVDVNKESILTEDFSPKVLKSYLFTQGMNLPEGFKLKERYVYDYELEFFTYSKGSMIIDDKNYTINKGDIVFRRPGQYTQGTMPYCCYLICFDLLGNTGKNLLTYDFDEVQQFQAYYLNPIIDIIPTVFHPPFYEKYNELFDAVLKEFIKAQQCSSLMLKSNVLRILYELYEDVKNPLTGKSNIATSYYAPLKRVTEYIEKNYGNKISLNKLSEIANLSSTYFHKVFTETLGITPNEYVTKVRVDKAKELLIRTDLTIYDIALKCGYENIPYFSYTFKKRLNISPSEFRKRYSFFIS